MSDELRIYLSDLDRTYHKIGAGYLVYQTLSQRGQLPKEIWFGENAMRARSEYERGLITHGAYTKVLIHAFFREGGLRGIHASVVHTLAEELVKQYGDHTFFFPRLLIAALIENEKAGGPRYHKVMISGSPIEAVEPFSRYWGFDQALGTEYHRDADGYYTGDMTKSIEPVRHKRAAAGKIIQEKGCVLKESIACGDSIDDAGMLQLAEFPFAINPEPDLEDLARSSGIPIIHEIGNRIMILRTYGTSQEFREVSLASCLPKEIAEHVLALANGRIRR